MADRPPTEAAAAPPRWDARHLLRLALRHRRALVVANVIALLGALISVPIPLLMPLLVDEVLLDRPAQIVHTLQRLLPEAWHRPALYIGVMLAVTLSLRLGSLLFNVIQTRQFTLISKDVTYRLRHQLLRHLERVSMAEYETLGTGTVTSHLVTDVNVIDEFIGVTVARFLLAVLTLVGVTGVLLWMHWQLALFILLVNPFVVYLTLRMGKKVKRLKQRENKAFELFQEALGETLDAIQQIRAANRQGFFLRRVDRKAAAIRTHAAAYAWKSDAASRLSFFIFLTGFEIFRALAMLMVLFSGLTIGKMMAVFGYLWFMMTPVQEVLNIQYAWYSARAALQRLNRLLALHPEPRWPTEVNPFLDKPTVGITVRDVCFRYGDGPLVLDHVNLDIPPGRKVALVGASGGGKSTLAQVIIGLYPPQSGVVLFDGVPQQRIGLEVIRENVGIVLQHPALFNETLRFNLTLGRDYPETRLWEALEVAQLKRTVEAMPDGLDTVIGRQGVRLSGGQRQRLAIARMVLGEPRVVILDEATSALDTMTEARLLQALDGFLAHRTTLIIAHRLSAVLHADEVFVFDNGRIIEQGPHEKLIRGRGLYQRLYGNLQKA